MKKNIGLFGIIAFFTNSCIMKESNRPILGKIAMKSMQNEYSIYDNSVSPILKFPVKNEKEVHYSGLTWMHSRDVFLGVEYIPGKKREDYKGNVVKFDLLGNIIERVYQTEKGQIVGFTYPSRSDRKLLFTMDTIGDVTLNPLEGLMRSESIWIMDMQEKKIIKKIENVGAIPNFSIRESPWLFDEDHFVYSIANENKIVLQGDTLNSIKEAAGVYLYDLASDKKKLIVSDGYFAVGSPTSNRIAFIKHKSVRVLDLTNQSEKSIYKIGSKEGVSHIHWTPDGKHIYIVNFNYFIFGLFTSGEKLIDVETGKEMPFRKIGHGFGIYTWK